MKWVKISVFFLKRCVILSALYPYAYNTADDRLFFWNCGFVADWNFGGSAHLRK